MTQPNTPPSRPPRVPDVMYGSHTFEKTIDEQGNEIVRDLGPQILHPWGPKGYQEDWKPNLEGLPDKRPHTLEKEANEILARRASRNGRVPGDIRSAAGSQEEVT